MKACVRRAIDERLGGGASPARRNKRKPEAPVDIADAFTLAKPLCTQCLGTGIMTRAYCGCVYRRAFRECLDRFRFVRSGDEPWGARREGASMFGYKGPEYAADFLLAARRTLAGEPELLRIFEAHHLGETPGYMGMERGAFFHTVYRIENRLGRVFLELRPYSIYPRAYFAGRVFSAEQFPPPVSGRVDKAAPMEAHGRPLIRTLGMAMAA